MKKIRYTIILVTILFLGSCAESTLEMEQECDTFYGSRSENSSLNAVLKSIRDSRFGGALWRAASEKLRMTTHLIVDITFRKGGVPLGSMVYEGHGLIYYNFDYENCAEFVQLAIHEMIYLL